MPQLYSRFFNSYKTKHPTSVYDKDSLISEMRLIRPSPSPCTVPTILKSDTSMTFIVVSSGATFGCTPFESILTKETIGDVNASVHNLSGSSQITKRGFGRWTAKDKNGVSATIKPFLYVVLLLDVRFFSPQDYFKGLMVNCM